GPVERDGAYHQGTVWGWLLGPFALAHLRVHGDVDAARRFLEPMAHHLADFCVGSIAEIFDGDPPFTPRGCPAQAWSVAEAPRAGEVKTRLCPPLTVAEAALLYRAFLLDKIEQVRSLEAASHAIAYTPDDGRGIFEGLAPDFILVPQRGGDLGRRLAASFAHFFAEGYAGVLLVDSDTP